MRPAGWVLLGAAGFAVMVVASAWAPVQPELIDTGAACQTAPCGTLEDPERWRQAWWLWSIGALVAAVAAGFVLAPRRPSRRGALIFMASAVSVAMPVAVLSLLLAVLTSVQGVATGAVMAPLVAVAIFGSWVRAVRPAPRRRSPRHVHRQRL